MKSREKGIEGWLYTVQVYSVQSFCSLQPFPSPYT